MTTRRQLDRIAERRRRTVLAAWNEVLSDIRDQATIQEIAHALNAGRVDSAVDLLQLDRATYEPLEHEILEAYREGGRTGAGQVGRIPMEQVGQLVARFDIRAPGAEAWAASMSSRLVVEIVEAQRETVREYIVQGLANGQNPRSVALDLVGRVSQATRRREGGIIALTSQQAGWVQSARQELESLDPHYLTRQLRDRRFDAAFERALQEGRPMRAGQIDAAVNRMQTRAERYRAETIARTESINALREGQAEAIRQAVDTGELEEEFATKTWQDTGDGRTRPAHAAADGQTVPIDQPFIVGGEALMYPGDPAGSAANTIQCFVPETPIAVHGLKSAIKREYSGQVVKLSAGSGVNLTVTPNHPVLTSRGWLPASEIVEGDKLIDCGLAGEFTGVKPDIANGITTAEQLYDAAQSLGDVDRVSRVVVNLHGEMPAKDVDVVTVDSALRHAFDSPEAEFCSQFSLAETDVSLGGLVFDRIVQSGRLAASDNPGRKVGGSRPLSALVRTGKGSASGVSFRDVWSLNSEILKASVDKVARYSKLFRYTVHRLTGLKKAFNFWQKRLSIMFCLNPRVFASHGSDFAFSHRRQPKILHAAGYYLRGCANLFGDSIHGKVSVKSDDGVVISGSGFLESVELSTPLMDSRGDEPSSDDRLGEPGFLGDGSDSFASLVEGFKEVEVTAIDFDHYDGPVYNFETASGMIVSGNTISHNCRCRSVYKMNFAGQAAKRIAGFS